MSQKPRGITPPDRPKPDIWEMVARLTDEDVIPEGKRTDAKVVEKILKLLVYPRLTDHLTGLASREAAEMRLKEDLERVKQDTAQQHPVTLVVLDLDGFKAINDKHGHQAGDGALKHFAKFVKAKLRPTDMVARSNKAGDEFLLVLDATKVGADGMVRRLREALQTEANKYEVDGQKPYLSFSFGVRQLRREDTDIATIINDADKLAIEDKENKKLRRAVDALESSLTGDTGHVGDIRSRRRRGGDTSPFPH